MSVPEGRVSHQSILLDSTVTVHLHPVVRNKRQNSIHITMQVYCKAYVYVCVRKMHDVSAQERLMHMLLHTVLLWNTL